MARLRARHAALATLADGYLGFLNQYGRSEDLGQHLWLLAWTDEKVKRNTVSSMSRQEARDGRIAIGPIAFQRHDAGAAERGLR
jgi:hypothetical protein